MHSQGWSKTVVEDHKTCWVDRQWSRHYQEQRVTVTLVKETSLDCLKQNCNVFLTRKQKGRWQLQLHLEFLFLSRRAISPPSCLRSWRQSSNYYVVKMAICKPLMSTSICHYPQRSWNLVRAEKVLGRDFTKILRQGRCSTQGITTALICQSPLLVHERLLSGGLGIAVKFIVIALPSHLRCSPVCSYNLHC